MWFQAADAFIGARVAESRIQRNVIGTEWMHQRRMFLLSSESPPPNPLPFKAMDYNLHWNGPQQELDSFLADCRKAGHSMHSVAVGESPFEKAAPGVYRFKPELRPVAKTLGIKELDLGACGLTPQFPARLRSDLHGGATR
jgi:hypothetical protein